MAKAFPRRAARRDVETFSRRGSVFFREVKRHSVETFSLSGNVSTSRRKAPPAGHLPAMAETFPRRDFDATWKRFRDRGDVGFCEVNRRDVEMFLTKKRFHVAPRFATFPRQKRFHVALCFRSEILKRFHVALPGKSTTGKRRDVETF